MKKFRISPVWWPVLLVISPILIPWLIGRYMKYRKIKKDVEHKNRNKISSAKKINLTESKKIDLTVLVEWEKNDGFKNDPGVSYYFETDKDNLLFDIGHGDYTDTLKHNVEKLNINPDEINGLAISHLHNDHMGGLDSFKKNQVTLPEYLRSKKSIKCYLPEKADTEYCNGKVINYEQNILSNFATTGPLERSMFVFGRTKEQAVIMKLKNKGIVVFTGCGHPTIGVILEMVQSMFDEPIYAVGGGLHFPIKTGRMKMKGFDFQRIVGTGLPPWSSLNDSHLNRTIEIINQVSPEKVFLSAHDTCDYSIGKFQNELNAKTFVLKAGERYKL